jgi:hypothetical protein
MGNSYPNVLKWATACAESQEIAPVHSEWLKILPALQEMMWANKTYNHAT